MATLDSVKPTVCTSVSWPLLGHPWELGIRELVLESSNTLAMTMAVSNKTAYV